MEGEDLYDFKASPGEHIPANRECTALPDKAPPRVDIRVAVKTLRNEQTGRDTMMRAEIIKGLLQQIKIEEKTPKETKG